MMTTLSPFRIDILDAADNIIGGGPLANITSLSDTVRLDAIGDIEFSFPAADERGALIDVGCKFDVYDTVDGYLGRFIFQSKKIADNNGVASFVVRAQSVLIELTWESVGFRRVYSADPVDDVIAELVNLAAGWTANVDSGIGNTSITYEGESVLAAVDVLRDRWEQHYRYKPTRILEFGVFGDDSGVRLASLHGQVQTEVDMHTEIAIATNVELVYEDTDIVNCIIPMGAGQGVSQIDISGATLGDYTVLSALNQDGSRYYYIEDATSIASYGRRKKRISIPSIRPISNSAIGILDAQNALKFAAEAYLSKHKTPYAEYSVSAAALRREVKVGDTIRLSYRRVVDDYVYMDIDSEFYVLEVKRQRSSAGARSASMVIATVAERRTSDQDVMLEVVRDVRALKVHVPITLAYAPVGPYVKRMDTTNDAEFTVRIKDEVIYCNRALLRFKTSPMRSSVKAAASGGGATAEAGGDHRHKVFQYWLPGAVDPDFTYDIYAVRGDDQAWLPFYVNPPIGGRDLYTFDSSGAHSHTVPDHTHSLVYGIFDDNAYPATISVSINGTDRTAALGGPWDVTGVGVEVEVDITDYIVNDPSGLWQNHSVVFSCDTGMGEIEVEIDMLVSIQAIVVT